MEGKCDPESTEERAVAPEKDPLAHIRELLIAAERHGLLTTAVRGTSFSHGDDGPITEDEE